MKPPWQSDACWPTTSPPRKLASRRRFWRCSRRSPRCWTGHEGILGPILRCARNLSHARAQPKLEPLPTGGGALGPDGRGGGRARAIGAPRQSRAGARSVPARACARSRRSQRSTAEAFDRPRRPEKNALPDNAILIARNLGPADLLEYDRSKLRGLLLEEGSSASHAVIVGARARHSLRRSHRWVCAIGSTRAIPVIVDAETGEAYLRPRPDVVTAVTARIGVRAERRAEFARLRDTPAFTRDGVKIAPVDERGTGRRSGHPR